MTTTPGGGPGSLSRAEQLLDRNPGLGLIAGRVLVGQEEREVATCRLMRDSPLPGLSGLPGTPVLGFLAVRRLCGGLPAWRREGFTPSL